MFKPQKNLNLLIPFGLYVLAALVWTWPLALHLGSRLPLGSESSAVVAYFNLWTLRWNELQISNGFQDYWNAPIFFPNQGSFAYSETMPLSGIVFWSLRVLGANYALGYNLLLLGGLALNGLSGFLLASSLGIRSRPAALAGLLAVGLPFAARELGVLQLVMVWPVLLSWRAWLGFVRRPGWRAALTAGLWFAISVWTSTQYALLLSFFFLPAALIFFRREHFSLRVGGYLIAGALTAALLSAPVLLPQSTLLGGFERGSGTVEDLSAQAVDYLRLDEHSPGSQWTPWLLDKGGSGQRLYPGTGYLLLALVGSLAAWRAGERRWAAFCLAGALLAAAASFGLNLSIAGWQPYQILRDYVPGFGQMRSPFRMALFAQLFLVGAAGFGLQRLWHWRGDLGRALAVASTVLTLLEVYPGQARLHDFPADALTADWVAWLEKQPPGAVVHLPYVVESGASAFEITTLHMLQGLEHGHPLANGYSGFFPASHRKLRRWMPEFPAAASLDLLRDVAIRYAVVDLAWWESMGDERVQIRTADLLLLYRDNEVIVFAVVGREG